MLFTKRMSSQILSRMFLFGLFFFCLLPLVRADEDDHAVIVLLFMFLGLGLCCFTMHIMSYYGESIPYTVVVFMLGTVFWVIC